MRTSVFQTVLFDAAREAGLNPGLWAADTAANALAYFNKWVKKGWEWEFWPEWTVLEQRAYRDAYDSTKAYVAPTAAAAVEVWFPAAQRYYQALQGSTGQAPAIFTNGEWVANAPYWADAIAGFSYGVPMGQVVPAPYFGSDWQAGTNYTAGPTEIHRNPGDNRYYQCILTHTSGGTFDPTKWGILTTFERYVSLDQTGQTPIGEVKQVTKNNPRTSPRYPGPLSDLINDKGILPGPNAGVQVWVEFRKRPPIFTLDAYNAGTTYALNGRAYQSTTGECYLSLAAGNIAHTPETSPTFWQKIDFPALLEEFVKQGVYSALLKADGKRNDGERAENTAFEKLSQASDVALASQGQYDRAAAQVY